MTEEADTPLPPRPTRNELGDVRDQHKTPLVFTVVGGLCSLIDWASRGFDYLGKALDIVGAIAVGLVLLVLSPLLIPLAILGRIGDATEKWLKEP